MQKRSLMMCYLMVSKEGRGEERRREGRREGKGILFKQSLSGTLVVSGNCERGAARNSSCSATLGTVEAGTAGGKTSTHSH